MKTLHMILWSLAMIAWTVFLTDAGKNTPLIVKVAGYTFLFFGYLITQPKAKSLPLKPSHRAVTIEDWLFGQNGPDVKFELPSYSGKNASVACKVCCKHAGNWVYSSVEIGTSPEDALQKAVLQIEQTVGTEWRAKRGLLPVTVESKDLGA